LQIQLLIGLFDSGVNDVDADDGATAVRAGSPGVLVVDTDVTTIMMLKVAGFGSQTQAAQRAKDAIENVNSMLFFDRRPSHAGRLIWLGSPLIPHKIVRSDFEKLHSVRTFECHKTGFRRMSRIYKPSPSISYWQ
jgi:hypothetical protein